MTEVQPIQIQIDPDALREQIRSVIGEEFVSFAGRLRWAADILDEGAGNALLDKSFGAEYKRGFDAGRAASEEESND